MNTSRINNELVYEHNIFNCKMSLENRREIQFSISIMLYITRVKFIVGKWKQY